MSISQSVTDAGMPDMQDQLYKNSSGAGRERKYPIWKKVLFISLAATFSLICGFSRLFLGAHSMDQIIFGWLLGAWLAFTYFAIIRDYVHKHVNDLTTGQTTSSSKVFYLISSSIWLAFQAIVTITFLVDLDKPIKFPNNEKPAPILVPDWDCAQSYDYWSTWAESAFMSAGLGGYFGILYQHKKYGGQLFIQQKID